MALRQIFEKHLLAGEEALALQALNEETLLNLSSVNFSYTHEDKKLCMTGNALVIACHLNMVKLSERLLDAGFHADTRSIDTPNPEDFTFGHDNYSLTCLMIACINKNFALTKLLINRGADITLQHKNLRTAFFYACTYGSADIVELLVQLPKVTWYCNPEKLLENARSKSFSCPQQHKDLNRICLVLKNILSAYKKTEQPLGLDPTVFSDSGDIKELEQFLSRNDFTSDHESPLSKKSVLTKALLKFAVLLRSPVQCTKYLKFLNDEFVRYYQHKHNCSPPTADRTQFNFTVLNQTWYPIPVENYRGNKKYKALQEMLIALRRKHNLGKDTHKWLSFLDYENANKMIASGDFVTESIYGTSILHGKISHGIQDAIMIYAVEAGEISLMYEEDGKQCYITMRELLQAQVTGMPPIWNNIRDRSMKNWMDFSDANRIFSVLMKEGESFGAAELADYLIDSFCQAYLKFYHVFLKQIPDLGTPQEFAEKLSDYPNNLFNNGFLLEYAKEYYSQRPGYSCDFFQRQPPVMAVSKKIEPDMSFPLNPFKA